MNKYFHDSWIPHLQDVFKNDEGLKILNTTILPKCQFYPPVDNIFRVFQIPLNEIKLVILGMDPYPNGEAIGYAFLVDPTLEKKPYSLKIIEEELGHPINNEDWLNKGVFPINVSLTVEKKKPGSHMMYWKSFSTEVVRTISNYNPCEWLLMGRNAQFYSKFINKQTNIIHTVPHPAAEAYSGRKAGFLGSCIFKKTNIKL